MKLPTLTLQNQINTIKTENDVKDNLNLNGNKDKSDNNCNIRYLTLQYTKTS